MRRTAAEIAINGVPLASIDPDVVAVEVQEGSVQRQLTSSGLGRPIGQHVDAMEQRTIDVTLLLAIALPRDLERRAMLLDKVVLWATQGEGNTTPGCRLTLNYRPGRYLWCRCVELPKPGTLYKWTQPIAITWRAYDVPMWQAEAAQRQSVSIAANVGKVVRVPNVGTAPSKLWLNMTAGSNLGWVKAQTATELFQFSGMSIPANQTFRVGFDRRDLLTATAGNSSYLSKLTNDSADFLAIPPGGTEVTIKTDASGTVELYSYGRWY